MNCKRVRQRLAAMVDAGGPDAEVDAHLAACDECRRFAHLLKGADAALRGIGPSELPAGLAARAASGALSAGRQAGPRESFLDRLLPVAWPAAAVAVAAAALLLFSARGATPSEPAEVASVEDPIATVTVLPLEMADPATVLIGGQEALGGEE